MNANEALLTGARESSWRGAAAVSLAVAAMALCSCGGKSVKLTPQGADAPWRFVRADIAGSGAIENAGFTGRLDILWQRDLSEKPQGHLSLAQGVLVYTGAKRRLFMLDPATGRTLAKFKNRSSPHSGGLLIDSMLYNSAAPPFNYLDCYRTTDGERMWRSQVLDISAPLLSHREYLYALGGDGMVYCLERFSGELVWEYNTDSKLIATPALDSSSIPPALWVAQSSGVILALNAEGGSRLFEKDLEEPLVSTPALTGRGLFVSGQGGSAFALLRGLAEQNHLRADSDSAWSSFVSSDTLNESPPAPGAGPGADSDAESDEFHVVSYPLSAPSWSSPAASDDLVVFSDNAGNIFCFDSPELKKPLWHRALNGGLTAAPIIVGEYVIVGLLNARIYALRLSSGEIVSQRRLDHEIRYSPVSDGENIYVATGRSSLYSLGESHNPDRAE